MKNIITLLLITSISYSQNIRFGDTETFNISILTDPNASIKEKGINIGGEIEMVSNAIYVRTGIQTFSVLEGGYMDWTTGIGLNLKSGYFDNFRYYAGGRLGIIWRDGNSYPTAGCEIGIEHNFNSGFILGLRGTYDYRSDFEYWGNNKAEMRGSCFIKIGWKL